MRLLLLAFVCTLTSFDALAQEPAQAMKPGDILPITLSGDLALEYGMLDRTIRENEKPVGVEIAILAIVERIEKDKVQLRHESIQKENGKKDRLIVLTAQIETKRFEQTITPKGTVVYASPADFKSGGKATPAEMRGMKLTLKDRKDATLRAWVAE